MTVDVPDLRDLAETLNRIGPCEYDRGFARGSITVACAAGPVVVPLRGGNGEVLQPGAHQTEC